MIFCDALLKMRFDSWTIFISQFLPFEVNHGLWYIWAEIFLLFIASVFIFIHTITNLIVGLTSEVKTHTRLLPKVSYWKMKTFKESLEKLMRLSKKWKANSKNVHLWAMRLYKTFREAFHSTTLWFLREFSNRKFLSWFHKLPSELK